MNRRNFLAIAPLVVGFVASCTKKSPALKPIETMQDKINAEYARMYDALKAKIDSAKAANKHLIILGAEVHTSQNSALSQLMLLDCAARLGVKNLVFEISEELLGNIYPLAADAFKAIKEKVDKNYPNAKFLNIDKKAGMLNIEGLTVQTLQKLWISAMLDKTPVSTKNLQPKLSTLFASGYVGMHYAIHSGLSIYAGDPLAARAGYSQRNIESARVIANDNTGTGSKFCVIGADHAAELKEALEVYKCKVFVVDNTLGFEPTSQAQKDLFAKMRNINSDSIYKNNLPLFPQLQNLDAYVAFLAASAKHKTEKGEMPKAEYEVLTRVLKQLAPSQFPERGGKQ